MLCKMPSRRSLGQINRSPTLAPDPFVENSHRLTHAEAHPLCLGLISSSLQSHGSRENFQKQYTAFAMGEGLCPRLGNQRTSLPRPQGTSGTWDTRSLLTGSGGGDVLTSVVLEPEGQPGPRFSAGSEEVRRASGFPPGGRTCWRLCCSPPAGPEAPESNLVFQVSKQNVAPVTHEGTSNSPMDQMSSTLGRQEPLDNEAGTECPRDQDDILLCEDVQQQDEDLSAEEIIFLKEFPIIKEELEVDIKKLHALADDINTTHRTRTKTNMLATSITVVSDTMGILGLVLAPSTVGGSLVLSAVGKVLETAAGFTSIFTNVMEHFQNQEARTQASTLVSTHNHEVEEARGKKVFYVMSVGKKAYDYGSNIKDVKRNIHAFQIARAHPRLVTAAKRFLTTGQVSARRSTQLQRAFKGTTVLIKKNARVLCSAMAGFSLCQDVVTLLSDWKQLKEGEGSKRAEELRAHARELERQLTELTQLYESHVQQQKLFQEKSPRSSSSGGATGSLA
uniref:apolipoprotein L6 isoform X1 n=2 Tax=Halichoerus grypus TaxID=9711 RepID=UPI001658E921|nr:apolipoprotein L6 isoform X1 [Halichoerus grypus]XP_035956081.1 apolipoprotein L6 isoform X1 [Halichoerus grypus]